MPRDHRCWHELHGNIGSWALFAGGRGMKRKYSWLCTWLPPPLLRSFLLHLQYHSRLWMPLMLVASSNLLIPWSFQKKELVVFPINGNEDVSTEVGGSHWSLLVYNRRRNIFEHYDSSAQCNAVYARKLFENIKSFIGPTASSATLTLHFTPQQRNRYNCGLFVLAIVKELCACEGNISGDDREAALKSRVTASTVGKMRSQILDIINELSS